MDNIIATSDYTQSLLDDYECCTESKLLFVCIQSTTPAVRSCSWEWPTSMLSGTVSRLSGLSAVRSPIQESKSIYVTFLSERLWPHLHLPPPSLFKWVHNTVRQHHTGTGTQSCSCWACQLSVCTRQPTAHVCYGCPFVPMFTCVFSASAVCILHRMCEEKQKGLQRGASLLCHS